MPALYRALYCTPTSVSVEWMYFPQHDSKVEVQLAERHSVELQPVIPVALLK